MLERQIALLDALPANNEFHSRVKREIGKVVVAVRVLPAIDRKAARGRNPL